MTIQQRIELLKRHGDFDPVLIAGILGLDLADVVGVLADPSHVPSSGGSGSQLEPIWFGFTFALAGIKPPGAGALIYTPTKDDVFLACAISVTTAFDATGIELADQPILTVYQESFNPASDDLTEADATLIDDGVGHFTDSGSFGTARYAPDASPVRLLLSKGGGQFDSDPGSMQGEGSVFLLVAKAP